MVTDVLGTDGLCLDFLNTTLCGDGETSLLFMSGFPILRTIWHAESFQYIFVVLLSERENESFNGHLVIPISMPRSSKYYIDFYFLLKNFFSIR